MILTNNIDILKNTANIIIEVIQTIGKIIMKVNSKNVIQNEIEENLYYANLQLTTISNNIDALIYISDMQTYKILYVNKYQKEQFGEDLIGKTCWESLHKGMKGPCEFCTNKKLIDSSGKPSGPYIWEIYNKKLKRWYEVHDQAIPWTDGHLVRLEMAMDISKRKIAEAALETSESRLKEAQFITKMGNWELDLLTNNLHWSDEIYRIFDLVPHLFRATYESFLDNIHPDDRNYVSNAYTESVKSRTPYNINHRLLLKNGVEKIVNERCETHYDEKGNPIRSLGTIQDITNQIQTENEIKKQLEEKEIILKEVHHRIKNNFTSIGSLLSLQVNSLTNPEAVSALKDAIGRVSSMQILYEKLLLDDNYYTASLKQYLENLVDEITNLFPASINIAVKKQIDDIRLDTKRLFPVGIIVNELLTNIIKYGFPGRESGLIHISLKKNEGNIILTIHDNGVGLPENFDINEQKGFGLLLIKMLSRQLNGNFTIENNNGTRSTLEFTI